MPSNYAAVLRECPCQTRVILDCGLGVIAINKDEIGGTNLVYGHFECAALAHDYF